MTVLRLCFIIILFLLSYNADTFVNDDASPFLVVATILLINFALFLIALITVTLAIIDKPNVSGRGLRFISICVVFLIAVNFISAVIRAPTEYEALTTISKISFANVKIGSHGYMVLDGLIGKDTVQSLQSNLLRRDVRTLILDSEGGSIDDALKIADLVRQHELTIVVPTKCSSACVLIAAASHHLVATKNANFGFHQASMFGKSNSEFSQFWSKSATHTLVTELARSGIPKSILDVAKEVPPTDMYYVSAIEMHRKGVVKTLLD